MRKTSAVDRVFRVFKNSELQRLREAIKQMDATRPVLFEGDGDDGDIMSYHYPEGNDHLSVKGSIYQWSPLVPADKPASVVSLCLITAATLPAAPCRAP